MERKLFEILFIDPFPEEMRKKWEILDSTVKYYKPLSIYCSSSEKQRFKVSSARKLFFGINRPLRCNECISYLKKK